MTRRLAALFLLIATFSFADTDMPSIVAAAAESKTHRHREGSTKQDRLMTFDNPDTYIFGTITRAQIFTYHNDVVTSIAVQPFKQSQIYEINLAFCGNEAVSINGKVGLVVITYRKQMSRAMCFDLIDVRVTDNE